MNNCEKNTLNKYDFDLDTTLKSSTGIILDKINPGETVLEIGCAAGRMTRYMKEKLCCSVYIVEIDPVAYDKAYQYATDGCCTDIMRMEWVEKFNGIEFDTVIMADVLEHLTDPGVVVKAAAKLLKNNGRIIMSIPNIAHNDLIVKAYNNRFDYTNVGLLDDTHVHFWGLNNILSFVHECGLFLHDIKGTYVSTGKTEQFDGWEKEISSLFLNLLKCRVCGEVYQFVFVASPFENKEEIGKEDIYNSFISLGNEAKLYFDYGEGFSEQNTRDISGVYTGEGVYVFNEVIKNTAGLKRLRFDPIEKQGCLLQSVNFYQNGKKLNIIGEVFYEYGDARFIPGPDPYIWTDIDESGDIIIQAELILEGEEYIKKLIEALFSGSGKIVKYRENELVRNVISCEDSDIFRLNNENKQLKEKNYEMHKTIDSYVMLANNKDELLINRNDYIEKCNKRIEKMQSDIDALNINNSDLRAAEQRIKDEIVEIKEQNRREVEEITEKHNEEKLAYDRRIADLETKRNMEIAALCEIRDKQQTIIEEKNSEIDRVTATKNQEIETIIRDNDRKREEIIHLYDGEMRDKLDEKDREYAEKLRDMEIMYSKVIEERDVEIAYLNKKFFNRIWNVFRRYKNRKSKL